MIANAISAFFLGLSALVLLAQIKGAIPRNSARFHACYAIWWGGSR